MSKDFQVTVHEPTRRAEFEKIFGSATVYVISGVPQMCSIEGGNRLCYMLDVDLLTPSQFEALSEHLAVKFKISRIVIRRELIMRGLPILADDCTLVAKGNGARLSLWMLDAGDDDNDFDYEGDDAEALED